jgi:hypothetical protein
VRDTFNTRYNKFDKIASYKTYFHKPNIYNKSIYIYEDNKLMQILDYGSLTDTLPSITKYFYKDTLVSKTISDHGDGTYKITELYFYDKNDKLIHLNQQNYLYPKYFFLTTNLMEDLPFTKINKYEISTKCKQNLTPTLFETLTLNE